MCPHLVDKKSFDQVTEHILKWLQRYRTSDQDNALDRGYLLYKITLQKIPQLFEEKRVIRFLNAVLYDPSREARTLIKAIHEFLHPILEKKTGTNFIVKSEEFLSHSLREAKRLICIELGIEPMETLCIKWNNEIFNRFQLYVRTQQELETQLESGLLDDLELDRSSTNAIILRDLGIRVGDVLQLEIDRYFETEHRWDYF